MRFDLITKLKAVPKLLLVKAKLKTIILCKLLFLFDRQNGAEIFIPHELGQEGFSKSYHFYDPIIAIIQEGISDERKQFFYSKKVVKLDLFKKYSFSEKLYDKFINSENKATFKYQVVNAKQNLSIDHHSSEHTMRLQKSKYLAIDQDILNMI